MTMGCVRSCAKAFPEPQEKFVMAQIKSKASATGEVAVDAGLALTVGTSGPSLKEMSTSLFAHQRKGLENSQILCWLISTYAYVAMFYLGR